jgi:hypothetical protein
MGGPSTSWGWVRSHSARRNRTTRADALSLLLKTGAGSCCPDMLIGDPLSAAQCATQRRRWRSSVQAQVEERLAELKTLVDDLRRDRDALGVIKPKRACYRHQGEEDVVVAGVPLDWVKRRSANGSRSAAHSFDEAILPPPPRTIPRALWRQAIRSVRGRPCRRDTTPRTY